MANVNEHIMAAPDPYYLTRGNDESARLERQHRLWNDTLGYDLHPRVRELAARHASPTIAEIGTGTSIWLRELSPTLPATARLVGFDISGAQFPPASALPANVELALADATRPVAAQWLGRFDAVHIRLLMAGMRTAGNWRRVARAALDMLRPGGALQWFEGDFSSANMRTLPGTAGSDTASLDEVRSLAIGTQGGDEFFSQVDLIEGVLVEVGFERTTRELVSCEKDPVRRKQWTEVIFSVAQSMLWGSFAQGKIAKEWTKEKLEELVARAQQDFDGGAYYEWNLNAFVGFKPDLPGATKD